MTNEERWEAAGVSKAFYYKCQKMDGWPVSGTDQEKIDFLANIKDPNRGRVPDSEKAGQKTDKKAHRIALRKAQAALAKDEQALWKNQVKIVSAHDDKFLEVLSTELKGLLEDIEECNLTRIQSTFLRECITARISRLSDSLKDLRQG